jgi:hypothetical protein
LVKEADGLDILIASIDEEPPRAAPGPLREPSPPAATDVAGRSRAQDTRP